MSKTTLLKAAFNAIYHTGLGRMLSPAWGGKGVIFCLHHVTPGGGKQAGFSPNSNLEISPTFLDDIITHVKAKGYSLLSLDDAVEQLKKGRLPQRFAVFTLDDGYLDNYVHAWPVFQRHACPFTVYVAPRIAEGTCELWWRVLELVISRADNVSLDVDGHEISARCVTLEGKQAAWRMLAPRVQSMPEFEQREWIRRTAEMWDVDVEQYCRSVAMTWDQIKTMNSDPLVTIGAHTNNHFNLKKLSQEDAKKEMSKSRARIEEILGTAVKHFAYPYGNKDAAGPREFCLAKLAGYETAVVTRLGTVDFQYSSHMHALPRLMVSGRYQQISSIDALMSGVPGRLANGFGALNVS